MEILTKAYLQRHFNQFLGPAKTSFIFLFYSTLWLGPPFTAPEVMNLYTVKNVVSNSVKTVRFGIIN